MDILSDHELLRYNRQIILKGFDFEGQETLKQSSVLMIGAGGLGCAASQYLAAAGVGKLTIVDDDQVELSNLQRQILHHDHDIGRLKVDSALDSLAKINPHCQVKTLATRLDDLTLETLIQQHDLVLDATDNRATRNQLNRLCYQHLVPFVSGAAIRMEGLIGVFRYQADEACYQCFSALFPDQQLSCVEAGVMSPLLGIIGSMQALEAIKVLTHYGQPLKNTLLMLDGMNLTWRAMKLNKQPHCAVCSQ